MTHASESQHWYYPDGTPAYEVEGAKGQMRPATLRDARKLGLYPGVTTIIRQAAAPQLERWKRNQVLLAALTLPRQPDEQETAWLARVESDWQEQGRKAAERGTACHKAIQGHYEGKAPDEDWWPQVKAVAEFLKQHAPEWKSEVPFADGRGFGSKLDLLGAADPWLIVDIKTKEFGAENFPTSTTNTGCSWERTEWACRCHSAALPSCSYRPRCPGCCTGSRCRIRS